MARSASPLAVLFRELRRRRVFRTAGYYVIGAWLLLQAGEVLFPGFGIPEAAIQTLFWAVVAGFPLALVFGWLFDIGPDGIRRTAPATAADDPGPVRLARRDWVVLAALLTVFAVIALRATQQVMDAPDETTASTAPAPSATPAADPLEKLENSVAVLPFDNLSSDPDDAYFADGIADEILNTLGRFTGINVIGRTSSFAFRYDRPPASRISELLGARFLLQGSVRRDGGRVRISTQLLDERGVQLWSERFDRDFDDTFAIQSEIAENVALTVAPRVAPGVSRRQVPDPVAYGHYLRGKEALYRRERPEAIRELSRAVELDPDFAPAHAELAAILAMGVTREDQIQRALHHIDRARVLDPGNARASAVEGFLLDGLQPPDLDGAERALRDALAREPNMADALNWLAGVLQQKGDLAAADAVTERGLRIDPLHPALAVNYGSRLVALGQPAAAEQRVRRLLDVPGGSRAPYLFLESLYTSQGRLADGYAMLGRMLRDTAPDIHFWLADSEFLLGRWERGRYWHQVDVAAMDEPWFADYRKPFVGHLETGTLVLQGRFEEAYRSLRSDRAYREDGFADQAVEMVVWLGIVPGLAGDCERTVEMLGAVLLPAGGGPVNPLRWYDRDRQTAGLALAWCLEKIGETRRAAYVLERLDGIVEEASRARMAGPTNLDFFAARIAALRGDLDEAVTRLNRAIDDGWRELNYHAREPWWANLRGDPRAAPLLRRVEADIAAERARAETMDAEWDPIEWHRQTVRARALERPRERAGSRG